MTAFEHIAQRTQLAGSDKTAAPAAQAPFLPVFLANERLRAYMRSGQLEIVLWDHLGECDGPPHMRCWQPLVYSHAVLEAWGSSRLLLISDIDEYFVTPMPNTTLASNFRLCGYNKSMVRPESQPARLLGQLKGSAERAPSSRVLAPEPSTCVAETLPLPSAGLLRHGCGA